MFDAYTYEGCFVECVAQLTMRTCGCMQIGSIPDVSRVSLEVQEVHIVANPLNTLLGTVPAVDSDRLRAAASTSEQHGLFVGDVRHH